MACERIYIKTHTTESRPENILLQERPCIFQPGNFTGCGSEGVKQLQTAQNAAAKTVTKLQDYWSPHYSHYFFSELHWLPVPNESIVSVHLPQCVYACKCMETLVSTALTSFIFRPLLPFSDQHLDGLLDVFGTRDSKQRSDTVVRLVLMIIIINNNNDHF